MLSKISNLKFFTVMIFIVSLCVLSTSQIYSNESKTIQLSPTRLENGKLLMQALKMRKSSRSFNEKDLPIEILSDLLWAGFGINRSEPNMRTAPSAHNWQEIDIYVAMKKGLYLYKPKKHSLELIQEKDIRENVGKQDFTQTAPVNLIYVADLSKMQGNEETKSFYSAADTGFISQNIYLYCASEGLATVILGLVDKPVLRKIMKLRKDQKIILTQPVGFPK